MTLKGSQFFLNFEPQRDAYGFTVTSKHLHRFQEYADIYKEEEEERLQKWKGFLEQANSTQSHLSNKEIKCVVSEVTNHQSDPDHEASGRDDLSETNSVNSELTKQQTEPTQELTVEGYDSGEQKPVGSEVTKQKSIQEVSGEGDDSRVQKSNSDTTIESNPIKETSVTLQIKSREAKTWVKINPSLDVIDNMMSFRVRRRNMGSENIISTHNQLPSIDEARLSEVESEEDGEEKFYDNEIADDSADASAEGSSASNEISPEPVFPWKEELEFLVRGGVPGDLRGEVWQAFVGVRTRRVEGYYQDLLAVDFDASDGKEHKELLSGDDNKHCSRKGVDLSEKWKKQIEKDLHRTFPGHPALNENGRNSLRRVLLAYARHNPSVGYCQGMNFFAGLLLLMMPEENAFWTLVGIIDDYFDGYFSLEMIESQVDQLVFEELMHKTFPKLVNHLNYLGVQVTLIIGPWFLSIFVNILPWESVLRVWDVILFEGNRVMLFRTALALMDLYGPAVVTSKDAGDAITLLQSLTASTFDSSQLVLTACMGFLTITEDRLQGLREKHRPSVVAAIEERAKGGRVSKDPKGLANKLYSFKHAPESLVKEGMMEAGSDNKLMSGKVSDTESHSTNMDEFLNSRTINTEVDSLPDLKDQVVWLKVELCSLLEEKRSATLRAEELEAALMEMVKQDNRRELSARVFLEYILSRTTSVILHGVTFRFTEILTVVEQLELEIAELRQTLADKKEQENAMLQVLLRVEQEQKVAEDARLFAEQDAAAQSYAVNVLQEKYEKVATSLAQMEKRAVMAESMLEATLQYETGQNKASSSPRPGVGNVESPHNMPTRTGLLSFGLGWRDRNKGKTSNAVVSSESKTVNEGSDASRAQSHTNGHQE
ncbi:ecotropic viral integration site 5 protein homolog isoform X2 [Olea europaea var. sylvestris]|uniref:ecotropic viral integration site 5 protein homolog isoform X2 n=1 Tax=Olea europaea var. sylvestris TaxID=158386 RepID=UPI000C1D58C5|nr:ecotropic viral integration site 5 protein homolog isoform X2 [Olea europaea var. sylvestris]